MNLSDVSECFYIHEFDNSSFYSEKTKLQTLFMDTRDTELYMI